MWPDMHERQGFAIKTFINTPRSNITISWNEQCDKSQNVTQVQVLKQNLTVKLKDLKGLVSIFVISRKSTLFKVKKQKQNNSATNMVLLS